MSSSRTPSGPLRLENRCAGAGTTVRSEQKKIVTASAEALALAPVGRDGRDPVAAEHVVVGEALGQLAGLGVAQPDAVAGAQPVRRGTPHRGLDLARALDPGQAPPGRPQPPR